MATICENAGFQGSLIAAKLLEEGNYEKGFNAANGTYVDMRKEGVIDPTKVVRTALVDSSSVASLMLTTECMIYDEPEKKDKNWFYSLIVYYNLFIYFHLFFIE